MDKAVFSSFQFNDNPDDYDTLVGNTKNEAISRNKEDPWFEMDEFGFTDFLSSVFDEENNLEKNTESSGNVEEAVLDLRPNEIEANLEVGVHVHQQTSELIKPIENKPNTFSLASWELLRSYSKGSKRPREQSPNNLSNEINENGQRLSTEEILKVAGERFIQFSTNKIDGISEFIHPYGSSLSGLSMDEARDIELVYLLLSAADNVSNQQFDVANKLISRCLWASSDSGTPVQRIAFYFAEALQEKVLIESGRIDNDQKKSKREERAKGLALGTNNTFLATHQKLPFVQVMQLAGIQAIIDNLETSRKIHLIDLQIRSGIQWTALMQGLADYPIQHLKITAVGTKDQLYIEETGKRLQSFAQSLNLPFSFKVVYVTDMMDFKQDLLEIEEDEAVAVYSYLMLRTMLSKPDCLENLMREITRTRPALMVVTEVEVNTNSPTFVDRFVEALFFYSVFFDCLEDCMERDDQSRMMLEVAYSRQGILNIVANEGDERITRNVNIDVWRAFFTRFGMNEVELSESSRYQANLVLNQFERWRSCTLDCNGKGLIVGWKGTPMHSLTIWKFS